MLTDDITYTVAASQENLVASGEKNDFMLTDEIESPLDRLPDTYRQVVYLADFHGFT